MTGQEKIQDFDLWVEAYYDELVCIASESGADRELDFDWDRFVERQYEKYLDA